MTALTGELLELIGTGPLAHLATINPDGSPQVSAIWVGVDGEDLVSGHLDYYRKLKNIERDPRVVLSFDGPREPGVVMRPHAILKAHATIEPSERTWDLLNRLNKIYASPDSEFPAPRKPGWIIRYRIEKVGGVGPWA